MWYHRNTKANPFVGGTRLLWQKTWAQGFPITLADFLGLPDNPRLFYPTLSQTLSFQFSSDTQSCLTLCDHMNCSMPDFPVHHQLQELSQTHVHQVGNTIQPSHPLSFPSPAFNLSQHRGLSQWVSSLHQVAKVVELQLQYQSFQWIFTTYFLWIDWFDLVESLAHTASFQNWPVNFFAFI